MTYSLIFMEFSAFHIYSLRFFLIKNSIMRVNMEKEMMNGMRDCEMENGSEYVCVRMRETGRE